MWLRTWFPERAWIAVENLLRATDGPLIERIERVGHLTGVPLVAAGDVHMHLRSRKPVLDVAAAIRLGKTVAECGFALASNAEQYLRPRVRLAQLYAPEWLDETLKIAARCQFSLNELRYEYPEEIVPPGATATSHLRALTEAGALYRFPEGVPPAVRAQIEKELALVAELKYEAFFLTIEDVVRFARSQGILCQGRGSAANSVVCYCLRITEVDPRRCNVLFERFISRERNEPPDIDVDFEHQRREESFNISTANTGAIARLWPPPSSVIARAAYCAMSARRSDSIRSVSTRSQKTTSGGIAANATPRE